MATAAELKAQLDAQLALEATVPTFVADDSSLSQSLATIGSQIVDPAGGGSLNIAAGQLITFPTQAVDPATLEPIGGEAFFYPKGGVLVYDVQYREQRYAEGTTGKDGQTEYHVLEAQFVCPQAVIGRVDNGEYKAIDPFMGRPRLAGRSLAIHAQTMGVTDEDAVQRLRQWLSANQWVAPNYGNATVANEDPSSKSRVLWRLAPPTGATSARAHLPNAIRMGLAVDGVEIRANNPERNEYPYLDLLAGILECVAMDFADMQPDSEAQQLLAAQEGVTLPQGERKFTNPVGVLSTSLTGITHPRNEQGVPDVARGRVPKRADMPTLTFNGNQESFWKSVEVTSESPV
jgi:hypothetical protein